MTESGFEKWIERFEDRLMTLEDERLQLMRDRRACLFCIFLLGGLSLCCLIAGWLGPSRTVVGLGLCFALGSLGLIWYRSEMGSSFKKKFREAFTRKWFHAAYPRLHLAPPPKGGEIPIEVSGRLREVCIRATDQVPRRTSIEEQIFFDTDTYHSWSFILAERSRWSRRIHSRAVVWFRANQTESPLVAFAWPPTLGSSEPKVRFFMDGRPSEVIEPLRQRLLEIYSRLKSKTDPRETVRVSVSPAGVWAGVKLKNAIFVSPFLTSALDPASYRSWSADARLITDREIIGLLFTI